MGGKRKPEPIETKIHRHIARRVVDKRTGCWRPPSRAQRNHGYASMTHGAGKHLSLHRVMLARKLGRPIRKGMYACHKCICPYKDCFNPDHLYEGTPAQNSSDMVAVGRSTRGKPSHGRKLTDGQVRFIRNLYGAPGPPSWLLPVKPGRPPLCGSIGRIAAMFDTSTVCISNIVNHRTYRTLTEDVP